MSLRLPPNFVNRAKPRQPQDPYSSLHHRYNFGLMYKDIWEPQLFSPIYDAKQHMENADAMNFIRSIMANFVEHRTKKFLRNHKSRDIIMERIGVNNFQSDLLADNFFVIDYAFLISKFKIVTGISPSKAKTKYSATYKRTNNKSKTKKFKSYAAYISKKFKDIINDILLPAYKAIWCIEFNLDIMSNIFLNSTINVPENVVTSIGEINIDEDLIQPFSSGDELLTFNDLWIDDEVGSYIYKKYKLVDFHITPLMIIEYYLNKLNKLLAQLNYYKISINETIIASLYQRLDLLNHSLKVIYNYDPQFMIIISDKKTKSLTSLTKNKSKQSYKLVARSI
jgi:hypothetical protein